MSKTYQIIKLPSSKIIDNDLNIPDYNLDDAILNGEVVRIMDNQVLHKIRDYYKNEVKENTQLSSIVMDVVNIVVPQDKNAVNDYYEIATNNFILNNNTMKRFCSGSGQIRRNTITFIKQELYDHVFKALLCGLTPEDFGDDFNTAKFNAYFGLNMSGCQFLKESPRVCVVDDYEEVLPHMQVDYITTNIENVNDKSVITKEITSKYYDEIIDGNGNPLPLNSFDGQGLCDPAYAKKIAVELGYLEVDDKGYRISGYIPSQYIIRAPWLKGAVVNFRWKDYCRKHGALYLRDIFSSKLKHIDDIDILISKSQFKMWKLYAKKGGWDYYTKSMEENNLRWGVVTANKQYDDNYKTLNYQYVNALTLTETDIDLLCEHTIDILTKLCSGNIEQVYNTLLTHDNEMVEEACSGEELDDVNEKKIYKSFLQKAVEHNYDLLQDEYIQEQIFKQSQAKFKAAKIGKVVCPANFQFLISDPYAQIQFIVRNHATSDNPDEKSKFNEIKVEGLLKANEVYSNYWNNDKRWETNQERKIVLMRSPMIDKSEIIIDNLVNSGSMEYWYGSTIKSGIILSIHSLETLSMQNCDFDGDRCYSSNFPVLKFGATENARPILYPSNKDAEIKEAITEKNLIQADIRGLNSKVGSISNEAACLYALLAKYSDDAEITKEILKRIKILGELVGVEIDRIKTSLPPLRPSDWEYKQIVTEDIRDENGAITTEADTDEEIKRKRKYNSLVSQKKPYYFRYIYSYLDKDITSFETALKHEALWNYNMKLEELLNTPIENENSDKDVAFELSEDDLKVIEKEKQIKKEKIYTIRKYNNYYPVVDSDCNVNLICRKIEKLEHELRKHKDSKKILFDYATSQEFDDEVLSKVNNLYKQYIKQIKFLTIENNIDKNSNDKSKSQNTRERFNGLYSYLQKQILNYCSDDIQTALNYMCKVIKNNKGKENFAWDIMGDKILSDIIPKKEFKVNRTGETNENNI